MYKAYIILAHKFEDQLYRLVERLDDDLSEFFIHIDLKADIDKFNRLLNFGNKIHFIKRENCKWGEITIVKAILNGFHAIAASDKNFDRISLLSGQDYPIKSNEYINDFFRTSPYSNFIEYWKMPNYQIWEKRGGMFRLDKYFFGRKKHQKFVSRTLNFLGILLPFLKRKLPYNLVPYGGWMWWTIDMHALNYILEFLKDHPRYFKFHRHSFVADEIFIQTILLNSKDERLLKSISNNYMRHIVWKNHNQAHPETLRKKDLENIKASESLYARKFDFNKDKEILDLIDKECLNQNKMAVLL